MTRIDARVGDEMVPFDVVELGGVGEGWALIEELPGQSRLRVPLVGGQAPGGALGFLVEPPASP
ncbi:MAG: hypothetical protein LBG11_10535 [Bifidobacteriaceae bacterium]|nr:hypothetical protein [Bifidobacteriaceae bacterium]